MAYIKPQHRRKEESEIAFDTLGKSHGGLLQSPYIWTYGGECFDDREKRSNLLNLDSKEDQQ